MTAAQMVRAFHRAFGLPVRTEPTFVEGTERDLRARMLEEECDEAVVALYTAPDLAAIAQELADVVYVAYGTALHYGIDLDAAVREVHASNMTKLWPDGQARYRADGKVLKGPNYRAPDMARAMGLRG